MGTTFIQAQSGYTAHASPVHAALSPSGERIVPEAPLVDNPANSSRSAQSQQSPPEPEAVTKPVVEPALPELKPMIRKTDIDWTTNSLVYRIIDRRSGQVVSQSPEEALLRLRAYAKQIAPQPEVANLTPLALSREL